MKQCFYEVLSVDKKAADDDIKKAYRALALTWHPDKNADSADATQRFQLIQEAYEVLSDPHERSWYDAHKNEILRGEDVGSSGSSTGTDPTRINLWRFFSATCFSGFEDDANSFYSVYNKLFVDLNDEEEEFDENNRSQLNERNAPLFGNSKTAHKDVNAFYLHWGEFYTRRCFSHTDKWKMNEAPNRQIKRIMQQDNQAERKAARREFSEKVRTLVMFVKKRDPRIVAWKREKSEIERREMEEAAALRVKLEAQRRELAVAAREAEVIRLEELKQEKAEYAARGFGVAEDVQSSESEEEVVRCDICKKMYKTENQLFEHLKSKKHKIALAKAKKMDRDDN